MKTAGVKIVWIALTAGAASPLLSAVMNPQQYLFDAAESGSVQMVAHALTIPGVNINAKDPGRDNSTALIIAAKDGSDDIVSWLLKKEAAIDAVNEDKRTALSEGVKNILVVQKLLKHNANPNGADFRGMTALMHAAAGGYLPTIKLLVENGANVNVQDKFGYTALMYAAERGYAEAVSWLLVNADANIFKTNNNGLMVRQIAIQYNHPEIVKIIDEEALKRAERRKELEKELIEQFQKERG